MNNQDTELEIKPMIKRKRWKIFTFVFIGVLIIIFLDARQQKQYGMIREAYSQMEGGQYEEALVKFEEYRDSHKSSVYWKLQDFMNGDDSEYGLERVESAIRTCKEESAKQDDK